MTLLTSHYHGRFLRTSGQNIDDLEKYSKAKDKLKFMERTLRWRHLAATAPNTLGCYAYTDRDPFRIGSCPHVYFIGNQDKYETRVIKGSEGQWVRLVCVPKFSDSGVAVMVLEMTVTVPENVIIKVTLDITI